MVVIYQPLATKQLNGLHKRCQKLNQKRCSVLYRRKNCSTGGQLQEEMDTAGNSSQTLWLSGLPGKPNRTPNGPINHTKAWPVLAGGKSLGDNLPALSNTGFSAEFPLSRAKISSHKALCEYEETQTVTRNSASGLMVVVSVVDSVFLVWSQ